MELQEILNAIYRILEASADRLASCSVRIDRPKGCRILEAGKVETDLFFIARGIARAYIPKGDREITFWIGQEGTAIVSLRSYVCNGAGYESVELMEDSSLYRLRRNDLDTLYREDIHIANWGRKFAESEFLRTEERLIPLLFTTASERYELLLTQHPDLLQRMPLECLATYLGVTPVSLSRIRAKRK